MYIVFLLLFSTFLGSCGGDDYDDYFIHMPGKWGDSQTNVTVVADSQETSRIIKDYIEMMQADDAEALISFEKLKGAYYRYVYYPEGIDGISQEGTYVLHGNTLSISGIHGLCAIEMNNSYTSLTITYDMVKNLSDEQLSDLCENIGISDTENTGIRTITVSKTFNKQ